MLPVPLEPLPRTKWGCPLLLEVIKSLSLFLPPTSFVMSHSSTTVIYSGCKVIQQGRTRQIEREHVEICTTAAYVHDFNNQVSFYNVFK